jgi:predicted nucleic acid-binding protein
VIILNSSPVIHLTAALGGLELLPSLYGRVLVPREVHQELEAGAHLDDAGPRLRASTAVEIITLAGGISPLLIGELDIGEAAVIQLAIDLPGATVVLDDLKARRVARRSGIALTGSLGILLDLKRAGKLASVSEAVERLRRHGAWLDDPLVERTLALAGEKP